MLNTLFPINISKLIYKIIIGSNDDLPLEKALSMHNLVVLIKSVFNKKYYYY